MPIYDYRCTGCGAQFEQLVRGEEQVMCPRCSSPELDRLLSLPARRTTGRKQSDYSRLGPPPGGGCCGGGCHSHLH
jgi:putative FmdB family regulatory protein